MCAARVSGVKRSTVREGIALESPRSQHDGQSTLSTNRLH